MQMKTKRGWEQSKIYKHLKRVDLLALYKDISKTLINTLCCDGDYLNQLRFIDNKMCLVYNFKVYIY